MHLRRIPVAASLGGGRMLVVTMNRRALRYWLWTGSQIFVVITMSFCRLP